MKKYFNNILYLVDAGGGGGAATGSTDYNINVSLEGFESAKSAITSSKAAIEAAVKKASDAAAAAKAACDADIGGAIESGISAPDIGNLNQAFADLENLLASVTKLDTTYNDQKSRLLAAIRGASGN